MTKPFAVFDIDGTLIRWQLYHVIVDRLAKEGALGESAYSELHKARMEWKRRTHPEVFKDYERTLINLYEKGLHNISTDIFDHLVTSVIDEYKDQTYVYTRRLARDLKTQGYMLFVISGSHHELIEQVAKYYEFDDWIGTNYERSGGGFSGQKQVGSHDKKTSLHKLAEKHNLSFADSIAIGDSASDIPMLEAVEKPIAFNPDRALFEAANTYGWNIIIERKNMIYELEQSSGVYILAQTKH